MTVSATPTRTQPSLRGASSRRGDQGLIALEWLLIVGAVAGLAASTVLVVQRVADDAAEAPVEPSVRFIDAEIAAAAIGAEATDFRLGQIPVDVVNDFNSRGNTANFTVLDYRDYDQRCDALEAAFDDIVRDADFVRPVEYFEDYGFSLIVPFSSGVPDWSLSPNPADEIPFAAGEIKARARCEVQPRA